MLKGLGHHKFVLESVEINASYENHIKQCCVTEQRKSHYTNEDLYTIVAYDYM